MGSSEKFCLRWKDFEENLSRSFAGIRDQSKFFDCTLITDDDEEAFSDNLRAHKVILSASSEFFSNVLNRESVSAHPNPLIYLRGVSAQNMMHMLDFMYQGEVNVAQEELDKFLEVAETLKIKGLTQGPNLSGAKKRSDPLTVSSVPSLGQPSQTPLTPSPFMAETQAKILEPEDDIEDKNESVESVAMGTEVFEESIESDRHVGDDDYIMGGLDGEDDGDKPSDDQDVNGETVNMAKSPFMQIGNRCWRCNFCSYKTNELSNAKRHFLGIHSDREDYCCQFCDRKFKTPGYQRIHEKRWHSHEDNFFEMLSKRQQLLYTKKSTRFTQGPIVSRAKKGPDPLAVTSQPTIGQLSQTPLTPSTSMAKTEAEIPEDDVGVKFESCQSESIECENNVVGDEDFKEGLEGKYEGEDDGVIDNHSGSGSKGEDDQGHSGESVTKTTRPFKKIGNRQWRCNFCPYESHNTGNVWRHVQGIHSGRSDYRCQFCDQKFKTVANQRRHEKRWHSHEDDFFERLSKRQKLLYKKRLSRNGGERGTK